LKVLGKGKENTPTRCGVVGGVGTWRREGGRGKEELPECGRGYVDNPPPIFPEARERE
jgi:hypothetical protein